MKIGILSDTHNRTDAVASALRLLQQAGAEFYIHCGDVGGPAVLDLLAGLPAAFVWGNTDWDRSLLQRYAQALGVRCCEGLGRLELGGKRLVVMHGDDHRTRQQVLTRQDCDYLLLGHSHVREDRRVGCIHLINPGALHRVAQKTVALLDTATDQVEFLALPEA